MILMKKKREYLKNTGSDITYEIYQGPDQKSGPVLNSPSPDFLFEPAQIRIY